MKFSSVTFRDRTELKLMPRANEYSLSIEQGTELELDSTGAGIIARNPKRTGAIWIPVAAVLYAEVLEAESEESEPVKRGPGRPPKAATA